MRQCFDAGYTSPCGRPEFDRGYGLGVAFEIERGRAASQFFRVDWDVLTAVRPSLAYPLDGSLSTSGEFSYLTWSVGARGYLRSGATLRPYGEMDVGVRVGGGDDPEEEGIILVPRIGVSWASFGGPGLSLESGFNFTVRDPERFLFIPIRFGIVFP